MWLMNNEGRIIVAEFPAGVNYEPATLSLTDADGNALFDSALSVILLSFKRQPRLNYSLQTTIGGDIYYSEFGEDPSSRLLALTGIAFNPTDRTDTSVYTTWTSFFNDYKGARNAGQGVFPRLKVTIDGKTEIVYLVGAPLTFPAQKGSVVTPLFGFQMQCVVIG